MDHMNIETLATNRLRTATAKLKAHIAQEQHAISDIVDDAGQQYVDLVMEGGGMLGIALVGYSWALEQMGIRFMGIGGTSAGSINALLLAALDTPQQAKSPALLETMTKMDFFKFVDGGKHVQRLIQILLDQQMPAWKKYPLGGWHALHIRKQLCSRYGLNPGNAFLAWLERQLNTAGIRNLDALNQRLGKRPVGLRKRGEAPFPNNAGPRGRLAIIATDITSETRVRFPDMACLYWGHPKTVSPALFARASMSIPFFFEPFRIRQIPQSARALSRWRQLAGYDPQVDGRNSPPQHALFVDGGIVSNFPIDAFHTIHGVPRMPTFGVKLQYDQRYKPVEKLPLIASGAFKDLMPLAGAMFNSARHTLDSEFIKKHPDFRHLVQYIPCTYKENGMSRSYNWLDFNMSDEHKSGLFRQGAEKAIEFVHAFSHPVDAQGRPADATSAAFPSKWAFYKDLRKKLASVN